MTRTTVTLTGWRAVAALVQVRLAPNPAYPPDAQRVRYYRMQFSEITGWTFHGGTNVAGWYLAVFRRPPPAGTCFRSRFLPT